MPYGIEPSESFRLESTAQSERLLGLRRPLVAHHELQVHRFGEFDPARETFIVVMGRGQSSAYSELWVRENQDRYNIFVYDQPYQGASTPVPQSEDDIRYGDIEDFSHYVQHLDNVVAEVQRRMDEAGVPEGQRPHLFGHSLGGYTVKRYNQIAEYADRVETVHTSAHMARIEVRPNIVRRFLGENAQLAGGLAWLYNTGDGVADAIRNGVSLREAFSGPVADPERAFENRSQRPWAQTTAPEHTAAAYAAEVADFTLRTDRPSLRWTNQGIFAALGLHMPWRQTYAPEFHIVPSHDVIGDPAFMIHSARTAHHSAYVTVEGMLHDGLMWPEDALRAYSVMQYAFVSDPDAMRGDQSEVLAEIREQAAQGHTEFDVTPAAFDGERDHFGDFLRLSFPFAQRGVRAQRMEEARAIQEGSRARWEARQ
ncbi:MAG: alpha/beta fold hydrolase [Myxococcota bacterium]